MSGDPFPRLYSAYSSLFTDDLPLWRSLADDSGDPILELGCGPGRVLLDLAAAGYELYGIDHDPGMLQVAESRIPPERKSNIHLILAEIWNYELPMQFPLIIVPCNTFSYLDSNRANESLTTAFQHISSSGQLVIDMLNPEEITHQGSDEITSSNGEPLTTFIEPESDHPVQVHASQSIDEAQRIAHVTWFFDELYPDGQVVRVERHITHHLRDEDEMCALLIKAGFSSIQFFGDYDLSPLTAQSPHMITIAQAKHQ
ncbi:MAG: methyltransferase domain-containing protein [Anaerolineales bacterium]|nr:methyltransferase domain-containing protein [Anaerolineales bacterium]